MNSTKEVGPVFGLQTGDRIEMSTTHPHHGKVSTVESFET